MKVVVFSFILTLFTFTSPAIASKICCNKTMAEKVRQLWLKRGNLFRIADSHIYENRNNPELFRANIIYLTRELEASIQRYHNEKSSSKCEEYIHLIDSFLKNAKKGLSFTKLMTDQILKGQEDTAKENSKSLKEEIEFGIFYDIANRSMREKCFNWS